MVPRIDGPMPVNEASAVSKLLLERKESMRTSGFVLGLNLFLLVATTLVSRQSQEALRSTDGHDEFAVSLTEKLGTASMATSRNASLLAITEDQILSG